MLNEKLISVLSQYGSMRVVDTFEKAKEDKHRKVVVCTGEDVYFTFKHRGVFGELVCWTADEFAEDEDLYGVVDSYADNYVRLTCGELDALIAEGKLVRPFTPYDDTEEPATEEPEEDPEVIACWLEEFNEEHPEPTQQDYETAIEKVNDAISEHNGHIANLRFYGSLLKGKLREMLGRRYEATLGPNTKQWWVYDNDTDEYIDPPTFVLEELDKMPSATAEDLDAQARRLEEIVDAVPAWLFDEDYRYDAEDTDI